MKRLLTCCQVLFLAVLLAGCQTLPLTESVGTAFTSTSPDKPRIRITEFPISKDEPGTKLVHFLVGGPGLGQPIGASIYDVTDEVHYFGNLVLGGVYVSRGTVSWLEYQAPAGRRILMLVEAPPKNTVALTGGSPLRQIDFIEVEAQPGKVKFIALTRHGFLSKPYFGEIQISETDRNTCESLTTPSEESRDAWKARLERIDTFMVASGIDQYTRDFRLFCHTLSAPRRIVAPTAEAIKQYAAIKADIEAARDANYPNWKAESTRHAPYDLMKIYRPVEREEP